jgi:Leucine-rich repeat (LRR) protein
VNKLTGPIPEELFGLTNLEMLYLNSNKLTGTISTRIGDLNSLSLQLLDLSENSLGGPTYSYRNGEVERSW